MIYTSNGASTPNKAHTIAEFITLGNQNVDHVAYCDLSYIETRNNIEFTVKNVIDDYIYEIKKLAQEVSLSDKMVRTYRYNPKKLSYDLYNTTKLYYIILKINDMCNVHDFSLANHKIKLLESSTMSSTISSIYNSESNPLSIFSNAHKKDVIDTPIIKYVYKRDPEARFNS